MQGNRLYKGEKLCAKKSIEALFSGKGTKAATVYPLRAIYRKLPVYENETAATPYALRFLINVPKRKFKKAVDRVLLRRRVREAYRLNRHIIYEYIDALEEENKYKVDVAFLYISDKKKKYSVIEERMIQLLEKIIHEDNK